MKRINLLSIIFIALLAFTACKKEDPTPGPTGATGQPGPQGPVGPTGQTGEDGLRKDGSITGKIYIKNQAGQDTLMGSFSYEYSETLDDAYYYYPVEGFYHFNIYRRSAKETGDYFNIYGQFISDPISSTAPDPELIGIDFSYTKNLGNGKYLRFYLLDASSNARKDLWISDSQSNLVISNYSFDKKTGKLKYDYEMQVNMEENSSFRPATIKGTIDVTLLEVTF